MPIPNLALPPDQNGYQATVGQTGISTKLDGGSSRFRSDQIGAASSIAVQWTLSRKNYEYLLAFYRTALNYGANAFTIDLILDGGAPTTYNCHFMPGSFSLTQQQGQTYVVSAVLEANFNTNAAIDDATIIAAGPDVV